MYIILVILNNIIKIYILYLLFTKYVQIAIVLNLLLIALRSKESNNSNNNNNCIVHLIFYTKMRKKIFHALPAFMARVNLEAYTRPGGDREWTRGGRAAVRDETRSWELGYGSRK